MGYYVATSAGLPASPPEGKRVPLGWRHLTVSAHEETRLVWKDKPSQDYAKGGARFRLTLALDTREMRRIDVGLAGGGQILGSLDMRYGYALQPFELLLDREAALEALEQGVCLRLREGDPVTFLIERCGEPFLEPHIMFDADFEDRECAFFQRLFSMASVQPFGWMEGCVLDGMNVIPHKRVEAGAAMDLHLSSYVQGERLIYEDPRSRIVDDTIYGIEAGLPFAVMALNNRNRPAIEIFMRYLATFDEDAAITDAEFLSAEGSYTIAYPLAAIAATQGNKKLAQTAVDQLLIRKESLLSNGNLYLRKAPEGMLYKNWGRAYVWYLLGLVRTLGVFKRHGFSYPKELAENYREVASQACGCLDNGLAHAFLGEEETGVDTSASAGIAAALFHGAQDGLINADVRRMVRQARRGLLEYLTPDGMLHGVAQSNKGGEALQRSGYRVISQMAMGLLAHIM